ncbi:MAG: histidine kinase, partial [Bacteroidota bacterium]
EFLDITIFNNYDPDSVPPKGTGTGLRNVQERLSLIYNRLDLIQTRKEEDKFTVFLRIPQVN